jgi:hypothetical protein
VPALAHLHPDMPRIDEPAVALHIGAYEGQQVRDVSDAHMARPPVGRTQRVRQHEGVPAFQLPNALQDGSSMQPPACKAVECFPTTLLAICSCTHTTGRLWPLLA